MTDVELDHWLRCCDMVCTHWTVEPAVLLWLHSRYQLDCLGFMSDEAGRYYLSLRVLI